MNTSTPIRIGTRGSPLALAQAEEVRVRLMAAHGLAEHDFSIEVISTAGDRIQDRPLSEVGGKGLFSKEIERALFDGEIDLAVHSSKDMATNLPDGLELSAFLPREDIADAFISPIAGSILDLPIRAIIGSSSMRRQALIRRMRPDIQVVMFRGNVQTRLRKLEAGEVHATLLATAGLNRLGLSHHITARLDPDTFPPAPGQGAICIETRIDDTKTRALIEPLNHLETEVALTCERAFLRALDGSCQTPIAGMATIEGDGLTFSGQVLSPDGALEYTTHSEGRIHSAEKIGREAGEKLREEAGEGFFHKWS